MRGWEEKTQLPGLNSETFEDGKKTVSSENNKTKFLLENVSCEN
ncbi:hypothetical protein SLEP1_g42238 [Rubroshorea leprosula]|uniref:Uncharacterized protein n=1 Tax=Rubroshorea leprosula TaxID=152421 RepID=A0AAV5L957_9ROSI|nr:hypothetical protein SLEP1_g42238 [Rubroshorea leprosula]